MAVDGIFYELDLGEIPPNLKDLCLDTCYLENQMREHNGGIALSELSCTSGDIEGDEESRKYVPHFVEDENLFNEEEIFRIVSRYKEINGPCSMQIDSVEKLTEHMIVSYQIAYHHYILGKRYNIGGLFPRHCCGISSLNVMLSLMEFGYPNAACASSKKYDHGYTILPFVFSDECTSEDTVGTVVIDPTSDQLWKNAQIRNAVFIKLGAEWDYRTDWKEGGNLFPDNICSIDTLKKDPKDVADTPYSQENGIRYFQMAFSNPVKI